jgi:hypothetical protein
MANKAEATTVNLGDKITLDQLISATSTSVLRALREHETQTPGDVIVNPKIWCGIWVDLDRFRNPGNFRPGGGPAGGGGIGG